MGIWLVGRTEIIASDRLFSQSDALIHLEDLFSTILRHTHDSTDFLGGINDSPTDSIGFNQSQRAFCVAAIFLRSSSLTFVHDAQFFMSRISFGHNFLGCSFLLATLRQVVAPKALSLSMIAWPKRGSLRTIDKEHCEWSGTHVGGSLAASNCTRIEARSSLNG